MSFKLPVRSEIVHKAIEPRNLSATAAEAVGQRLGDDWEVKYDGCNGVLIKADGEVYGFSRQGLPIAGAMNIQLSGMKAVAADNFVLMVEGWSPDLIFSDINGAFRRGYGPDEDGVLKAVVFDMVPLEDFIAGRSYRTFDQRRHDLINMVMILEAYGFGQYFEKSFLAKTKDECIEYVEQRRALGAIFPIDGFMRKAHKGHWIAGSGSGGEVIKDKEVLSVDLKVIDLIEGQGKFKGMLGAFLCEYKGKPQKVQGGKITTKRRKELWVDFMSKEGGVGSIIEVHALGESTNGLLREPRMHRCRPDKNTGE